MNMSESALSAAVDQMRDKSADDIAAMMRRRGITGRPGTTGRCPLAVLMHNVHGGQFIVGRKFIARTSNGKIEKIPTPRNMATFIRRFDLSQYSYLIAPPPRCLTDESKLGIAPKRKHGKNHPSGPPSRKHREPCRHPAQDVGR